MEQFVTMMAVGEFSRRKKELANLRVRTRIVKDACAYLELEAEW
jgi:hypothetical protein